MGFNLIIKNKKLTMVIFENNNSKSDAVIEANIFKKTIKIKYKNNEEIKFNNVNPETIEKINNSEEIFCIEICKNTGKTTNQYKIRLIKR